MCPKLIELLSWNGPTVHVYCFMLARASTETFVSRIHIRQPSPKTAKKSSLAEKFVRRVTRQPRYHCSLGCLCFAHLRNDVSMEDCMNANTDTPSHFSYVTTFRRSGGDASEETIRVRKKCRQQFENAGSVPQQLERNKKRTDSFKVMLLTFWTRNYFFSFSTPCI